MALKPKSLENQVPRETSLPDLALLSPKELLHMRSQIDSLLDLGTLKDIDLAEELTLQLKTVKLLQAEANEDNETPFGQKAQTAMAVQRLLQDLVKLRNEVHNAEFAKQIESMVIMAFTKCAAAEDPAQAEVLQQCKDLFFEAYEALLGTLDQGAVQ